MSVSISAAAIRFNTSAEGAPPRPCSSQVYQVGLMLERWRLLLDAAPAYVCARPQNPKRLDQAGYGDP
jgi:hypothetical protein